MSIFPSVTNLSLLEKEMSLVSENCDRYSQELTRYLCCHTFRIFCIFGCSLYISVLIVSLTSLILAQACCASQLGGLNEEEAAYSIAPKLRLLFVRS